MSIIIGSEAVVGNKLVLRVLKSFFKKLVHLQRLQSALNYRYVSF